MTATRRRRVELVEQADGSWRVIDSRPKNPQHLARPESLWEAALLAATLDDDPTRKDRR